MKKILVLLLGSLAGSSSIATAESPFRVGEPAPRLVLPSIGDGTPMSLADFHGKRLMVHVWASW